MQVEIKKELDKCKLLISYVADPEKVQEKRSKAIAELRKLAIPGFRPNKAPDYAIKAKCKKQIDTFVAKEMAAEAYDDVLFETKIKPIGQPQFSNFKLNNDNFSCELTVSKKPDVALGEYKGLEVPKPHLDTDVDKEVEATLQDIRFRYGEVNPYKDGDCVAETDQVTMDLEVSLDGSVVENLSQQGMLYSLGDSKWPGFDDNLLGMLPGEEKEFDYTLPETVQDHAGKTAKFKVKLHMGMKRIPCSLDDELAKKVQMKDFEEVKQQITTMASNKIKNTTNALVRQQVSKRLVENHEIDVPLWLTTLEAQHMAMQNGSVWQKLEDKEKEDYLSQALNNVKLSLILDSVREIEPETVLADNEVIGALNERLVSQGVDPQAFITESQKNGRLIGIVAAMRDEFTLQWLIDQAKLVE